MCGIAGTSERAPSSEMEAKVKKMLEILGHRGPDACGIHSEGKVSMGNTLLKITGDMPQPLRGEYGTLVLNGEIYNFREIAKNLGLRTLSDTETLLRLIETERGNRTENSGEKPGKEPGTDPETPGLNAVSAALSQVNGDYALAYLSGDELVLARDPLGVKPLFCSLREGGEMGEGEEREDIEEAGEKDLGPELFFASEKKALRAFGVNPFPLPPGTVLSFNLKTGKTREKSLKIQFPTLRISDELEASAALRKALEKAVSLRLSPGCGIAFSGGIDSAVVAALAGKIKRGIRLYAVGLPDSHDLAQAEFAARALGLEASLVTHVLSPEEIEAAVPHVIKAVESTDPMKISIGLPLYIIAKHAREDGVKVLLTGQGSDELLAGYRRHETFLEAGREVLDREIYLDLCKISELNLERDDMVTMASGVELRVPFLDPGVVKVGLAISPELKVRKTAGAYSRKHILRKAAEALLSPELALKEKKAMQYGTGVQKVLDKLARDAGFSRKEGNHIEKYLTRVAGVNEILH